MRPRQSTRRSGGRLNLSQGVAGPLIQIKALMAHARLKCDNLRVFFSLHCERSLLPDRRNTSIASFSLPDAFSLPTSIDGGLFGKSDGRFEDRSADTRNLPCHGRMMYPIGRKRIAMHEVSICERLLALLTREADSTASKKLSACGWRSAGCPASTPMHCASPSRPWRPARSPRPPNCKSTSRLSTRPARIAARWLIWIRASSLARVAEARGSRFTVARKCDCSRWRQPNVHDMRLRWRKCS